MTCPSCLRELATDIELCQWETQVGEPTLRCVHCCPYCKGALRVSSLIRP